MNSPASDEADHHRNVVEAMKKLSLNGLQ